MRLSPLFLVLLLTSCGGGGGGGNTPEPSSTVAVSNDAPSSGGELIADETNIPELLANLDGLAFVEFTETSFEMLTRRYPETAVSAGLPDVPVSLNNLSSEYVDDTYELADGILTRLLTYQTANDREATIFGVYQFYLEDFVAGADFQLFTYPASYFITGVPSQTSRFFSSLQPLHSAQDATDYVDRLGQVDTKFKHLESMVIQAETSGIVLQRDLLQFSIDRHRQVANAAPDDTAFISRLVSDLPATGLSTTQQQDLINTARSIVESEVQPAYQSLSNVLENQLPIAPTDVGVGRLPGGDNYYRYALRHHTTTDLTADEIHELGLTEMARIHADMRNLFDQLGYPATDSISNNLNRAAVDGGTIQPAQVVPEYERILTEAQTRLPEAFGVLPRSELIVVGGTSGGFYIRPSPDGSRPGAFHAANTRPEPAYLMKSLAYHEGVPGHHLQIALAQETGESVVQQFVTFTGFVEGWALYAERLAAELGWYENDPYGDLGRLQYEAFRAGRLVVDTGIHHRDWSFDQAASYFEENTGFSRGTSEGQIARYTVWPGQATAYMVGMLEILKLRESEQLNPDFDLSDFHDRLLQRGSVPLTMLAE